MSMGTSLPVNCIFQHRHRHGGCMPEWCRVCSTQASYFFGSRWLCTDHRITITTDGDKESTGG